MATDGGVRSREAAIAVEAAARWVQRRPDREAKDRAIADGRFTDADEKKRVAKRIERLEDWHEAAYVRRGEPAQHHAEGERPAVLLPETITDELVERVLGETRDLLSIEFFEQGLDAARSVGRIVFGDDGIGTGFLVGCDLLMTNEHVLRTMEEAQRCSLEMDFEANKFGPAKETEVFDLEPARFFLNDRELDFALVAVAPRSRRGTPLAGYGCIPLIATEGKVIVGEAVNIIQHPGGKVKQIAIRNNRLRDLPSHTVSDRYFHYDADTEKGSSGSPVFNDQWEIVALHHSGVPKTDEAGHIVDADGRPLTADDWRHFVYVANEGIRVSRLVSRLEDEIRPATMDLLRKELLASWHVQAAPAAQERAAEKRMEVMAAAAATATPAPPAPPGAPDPGPRTGPGPGSASPHTASLGAALPAGAVSTGSAGTVVANLALRITVELGPPDAG